MAVAVNILTLPQRHCLSVIKHIIVLSPTVRVSFGFVCLFFPAGSDARVTDYWSIGAWVSRPSYHLYVLLTVLA
jgi:hypothetical protein